MIGDEILRLADQRSELPDPLTVRQMRQDRPTVRMADDHQNLMSFDCRRY